MPVLRSRTSTHGRNMAGARGLWRATGMKDDDFGKPIVAIVNSFTQFVPGHVHLKDLGQLVAREVEKAGGVAKEFNTIAVDDGIAMGHDGMLYSLPSREIIADSTEYMVNAHCADAMVCISNCDKITPGMLMAAMRLNIPCVFVSGGPMEAGKVVWDGEEKAIDLVDAMVAAADENMSDEQVDAIERSACPTCGSCSGMFTANSMNCLTEALGLSLPGNGSVLATHADREALFREAGHRVVDLCKRFYEGNDHSVLPRNIASFKAFENAMTLDISMGGSTNTVLHLLAAAYEGEIDFTMQDIDRLSRNVPCLCKVAPAKSDVHMEDVHRAGGIMAILGELDRAGSSTAICPLCTRQRWQTPSPNTTSPKAQTNPCTSSTGQLRVVCQHKSPSRKAAAIQSLIWTAKQASSAPKNTPSVRMAASPSSSATSPKKAASSKQQVLTTASSSSLAPPTSAKVRIKLSATFSQARSNQVMW